jgi:hypothetical protein
MNTTIQLQSGAREADIVTALSKLSAGGALVLPKGETILIGSGLKIDVSARSVTLDLNGSTLKQAGNTAVITANGATGPVQSVKIGFTADGKTTLTYPTTPQGAAAGDWIKVFSDDRLPFDHVDGGHPTRLGQAMKVVGVTGNTVVLEGKPVYGELYKTNVRAAEIRSGELSIVNGTVQGNQAQTTWKSDLVHVRNTVGAQIERLTVKDGNSIGINIVNSVNAEVTDSVVKNLKDNTANGNFGYGVHSVSSVGTTVTGLYAEKVRHATDNYGNETVAGTFDITRYGADIGFVVRDSVAYATTNNAWGWHSEGVNGVLERVMSFDSHGSIGARGVGHRVTDASSVNDQRGILLYEYGDGDARNMTFDRMLTKETGLFAYAAVGAPTGNTISNSAFEVYGSAGNPGTTRLVNNTVVKADANENDDVTGGAGADRLLGGKGLDTLQGAGGDDLIWGGAAADVLAGARVGTASPTTRRRRRET